MLTPGQHQGGLHSCQAWLLGRLEFYTQKAECGPYLFDLLKRKSAQFSSIYTLNKSEIKAENKHWKAQNLLELGPRSGKGVWYEHSMSEALAS